MSDFPPEFIAEANRLLDVWAEKHAGLAELLRQQQALDEQLMVATAEASEAKRTFDAHATNERRRREALR